MAKTKISEFSSTPANNTDIDSINIAEGCSPSGINDAIRELMSQLKDWQSGTSNDPYVVGSSGSLTLNQGTANTVPYLNGSKVVTSGTALSFDGNQLGVAVTPSAWEASNFKTLELPSGSFAAYQTSQININQNAYYAGAPNYWTYKSTAAATQYRQTAGAHSWYNAPSGTAGNAITFTQAMTLDASGNLGIGTTSPASKLHVVGNTRITADIESTGNSIIYSSNGSAAGTINAGVYLVGSDSSTRFYTGNSERARIDSSGNLLVGTTSAVFNERLNVTKAINAGYGVAVFNNTNNASGDQLIRSLLGGNCNNTSSYLFVGTVGSVDRIFVYGNGNIVNSNNSYGALSDIKLKENVTDATPKLEKLNQVRVVNYNLIGEEQKQLGVIAQELEQIFPSMIDETPDRDLEGNDLGTTTKSVKYSVFVPMLIKAIQEQQALITQLQADVAALKA